MFFLVPCRWGFSLVIESSTFGASEKHSKNISWKPPSPNEVYPIFPPCGNGKDVCCQWLLAAGKAHLRGKKPLKCECGELLWHPGGTGYLSLPAEVPLLSWEVPEVLPSPWAALYVQMPSFHKWLVAPTSLSLCLQDMGQDRMSEAVLWLSPPTPHLWTLHKEQGCRLTARSSHMHVQQDPLPTKDPPLGVGVEDLMLRRGAVPAN